MSKSDEELMRQFQQGDERAFVDLYDKYKLAIYRFLYQKLGSQARAQDIAQEVFVALIEHKADWRQESSFKTYLYRIAFNRAISDKRRSEHKVMINSDDEANQQRVANVASDTISPAAKVEQQEVQKQVKQALAQLDPEQRDPIILREYEELSYEEISVILNVPIGTVKSRIFRGKVELKRLLEPLLAASQHLKPPGLGTSTATPSII